MSKQQNRQHDKGYGQLLANTKTFLQLIQTFIAEDWVKEINERDLIKVDKTYVLQDFEYKEADLVYRLKTKDKDIIFYVLLEMQSKVDHLMPYRLLLYMVEIWRDIFNNTPKKERERKNFRLPAIIPAVLYNGAHNWTAVLDFKEMQANYQQFEKHLLNFRYILFDVNRYSEKELHQASNLISTIFTLDRKIKKPQELTEKLRLVASVLKNMHSDEFRQFVTWFKNVLKPRMPTALQEKLEQTITKINHWEVEEMISNIEISLQEMQEQALIKGELRGLEKGELRGMEKNALKVARKMLLKGMPLDTIVELTELSQEEVLKLMPN